MKKEVRYLRVSKKRPCPICGKPDNCKVSDDGTLAYCRRIAAGGVKEGRDGGYVHVLIETDEKPRPRPAIKKAPDQLPSASVSVKDKDAIYTAFLRSLVLSHDHRAELFARGLSETDIHLHGYRSMPGGVYSRTVCRLLAQNFDLRNVPGFYYRNFAWHFVDYFGATGYLVPIRNFEHKIVALQLRRDDDRAPKYLMISSADKPRGASSGTPPHFATLNITNEAGHLSYRHMYREAIVTEGALKANIIAAYSNVPTVGLVGVTCFGEDFGSVLKDAFPNLDTVKIAFDMDAATNEAVRRQRDRLVLTLEKINLKTRILSWNRLFKGFDDYLVSNRNNLQFAA
ncbi:MAG TPA: DUF3854 domain-containing protein [Pyrinomonadaceae bacterium]|jgi:hypothetical protein